MSTPDLTGLPATDWRDAWRDDTVPAFRLTPVRAGVHLGTAGDGRPVTLPAPGPAGTRICVLGESLFGRLIALRLLALGVRVSAATRVPDLWPALALAAGDRLTVTDDVIGWPSRPPAPPTVEGGPQALVCDLRRPPPARLADGRWRTVVHVSRNAPRRSAFWSTADVVLALDARFAEAVGRVLGDEPAGRTAALSAGEIVVFRRDGGAESVRPDISPGETALLTPGRGAPRPYVAG